MSGPHRGRAGGAVTGVGAVLALAGFAASLAVWDWRWSVWGLLVFIAAAVADLTLNARGRNLP